MIVDTDKLVSDAAYLEDMRYRFLTDHFFAGSCLGFRDFSPRAHAPAVALYFPKNPKIHTDPNQAMRMQSSFKFLLHMDPRKTFKTTLNRIDSVQWVCAFPEDVTLLNESATQPLAKDIGTAVGGAFWKGRGGTSNVFQLLWSHLLQDKKPEGKWNTPNRRIGGPGDLDSTMAFTSPESTQSGWHPMVIKSDDVEDTENSGITANDQTRQNIKDKCDQNENLLREGGYKCITGTRYHPFDWYGSLLLRAKRNPDKWKVLVRCSITRLDGGRFLPGEFPREDEIELQFPEFESLSYNSLRDIYFNNYESFMCQQQNDPQGGHVPLFEQRFYDAAQIAPGRIPVDGETFICWRPRNPSKDYSAKYSEGAAARVVDGRIYVLDAWKGTYSASTEAAKIVHEMREHEAAGLMLLTTPGHEYLMQGIRNEALRKCRSVKITPVLWEEDDHVRSAAIEQLEPMLNAGRIQFSTAMREAEECRNQFVHFGIIERNGIIECIQKFTDMVPISLMRANISEQEIEWHRQRRDDALMSQFMQLQGVDAMDLEARQREEAHAAAMSKIVNQGFSMPGLPGGLDG